jgi:putative endonuclease
MSRLWKVYMVKCAKGALYTGIALDVLKRLAQHNAGTGAKSIRALGRPVRLMYSEIIGSKRVRTAKPKSIKNSINL